MANMANFCYNCHFWIFTKWPNSYDKGQLEHILRIYTNGPMLGLFELLDHFDDKNKV